MTLRRITEGLPYELTTQLINDEPVYYFSFISSTGGCGGNGVKEDYWISLTSKRVIYKTKVKDGSVYVEKDGILPFEKVSFIEVSENNQPKGCSSQKGYQLSISTSGGAILIPIPTKEKGYEIRQVFSELNN